MLLFFSDKLREYILVIKPTDHEGFCCNCRKHFEVGKYVFIHKSYSKKEFKKEYYCPDCIRCHKKRVYDEFITARVTTIEPSNSKLIMDTPPTLRTSNATVWSAAVSNAGISAKADDCVIEDHCKVANEPNRNIQADFKSSSERAAICDANNKILKTEKQSLRHLNSLKVAGSKKKQLEAKE